MINRPIRVYADASVYGGVFDEEFKAASREFFDLVREGRFQLVISTAVSDELMDAPEQVRALFEEMRQIAGATDITDGAVQLQEAYLAMGIVGQKWDTDAMHVAMATESQCAAIVSWNFKHIVNFKKIPLYNGVNLAHGYAPIAIHTPPEVIANED